MNVCIIFSLWVNGCINNVCLLFSIMFAKGKTYKKEFEELNYKYS